MEVWHGVTSWGCFRRLSETGAGLRADDGANSLSHAGSSLAVTDLRLAELRSVSEIPGAKRFPGLLAAKARRTAVLGHCGAFQADQAGRAARRRRRVQAALRRQRRLPLGQSVANLPRERPANGRLRDQGGRPWPSKR